MVTIYLDNAATTRIDPKVIDYMNLHMNKYGNPSSLHDLGQESRAIIEESRGIISNRLKVKPEEIIFTSCGSESNNLALKGIALRQKDKHIITSKIEHSSVLNACKFLENFHNVDYLCVDKKGFVDIEDLKNKINKRTILISIQHSNNEIGTLQDINEIGKICKENNILFHVDAVQSLGKLTIDLENIDLMSISAHKIYGPKGIAALYVKENTKIDPLIHGGSQEFNLRAGTENPFLIAGFGKAVQILDIENEQNNVRNLRDYLIDRILNEISDSWLNSSKEKRLPGNVNIGFKDVFGEDILKQLNFQGIYCSTGSACSQGKVEISHVLKAIGLNEKDARSCIRLTLGRYNNKKEIDYTAKALKTTIESLRKLHFSCK